MLKKIFVVIALVVVLAAIVAFIFRHEILRNALQVTIDRKTNETVEFVIGDLSFNVWKSEITFDKSSFHLNNVYVNKQKSIEINEFTFDELSVVGLSIYHLIVDKEIIADDFIIINPKLLFSEGKDQVKFHEKPEKVIEGLKEQPKLLGDLVIKVNKIEILEGKIDMAESKESDSVTGTVRFKLVLRDFNTQSEDLFNENRVLFAKEHFFKLSDFQYSFPNGDTIGFDSVVLSSNVDILTFNNIRLYHRDTSAGSQIQDIDARLSAIQLFGINVLDIHNFRDISLDSLDISDSDIIITVNPDHKNSNSNSTPEDKSVKKFLEKIGIGKFAIYDLNLTAFNPDKDSLIRINNFNFKIDSLTIDSNLVKSHLPDFKENSILVFIESIQLVEISNGLNIELDNLLIDDSKKSFSFSNLNVNDNIEGIHSYRIFTEGFRVDGISIEDGIKKKDSRLKISLTNPMVDIDIERVRNRKGNRGKSSLDNITIDGLNIEGGQVHIKDQGKFNLMLNNLDLDWNSIGLKDFSELNNVNFNDLTLLFEDMSFISPDNNLDLSIDKGDYRESSLKLNKLSSKLKKGDDNLSINIAGFDLEKINLQKFLKDGNIEIGDVNISKPNITGKWNAIKGKTTSQRSGKAPGIKLDYISFKNGILDLNILNSDIKSVESSFNIDVSDINIEDYSNYNWLETINWNIYLMDTKIQEVEYAFNFTELASQSSDSGIIVKKLQVAHKPGVESTKNLSINKFHITELGFEGVDYMSLIHKEKPEIRHAILLNPVIDLSIRKKAKTEIQPHNQFNTPLILDELTLQNLEFNMDITDSISSKEITVDNMSFNYLLDGSSNFVDDIAEFSINSMKYIEKDKGLTINLGRLLFDSNNNSLFLESSDISSTSAHDSVRISYDGLNLNRLIIGNSFPTSVEIERVDINDVEVGLVTHPRKGEVKKSSNHKTPDLPPFISELKIDSFGIYPLHVSTVSFKDTIVKKAVFNDLEVDISNILIDSTIVKDHEFDYAESITIGLNNHRFISKDSLYYTSVKSVFYDFKKNQLNVDSLQMVPRFADAEFFKKAVYQTGRTKLVSEKIVCEQFDIARTIKEKEVDISSVDVYGLDVKIYRNKHYEMNPKAFVKLPQATLLGMKEKVRIDSVITHNARIQYQELAEKSYEPGMVFLDQFNLKLLNINNIKEELDHNSMLSAKLNAMLMGKSALSIDARFQMLSPDNNFWVTGHLDRIDFTDLNIITQNLVGVTMQRGYGSLDIPLIKGNEVYSTGEIFFHYKKLKIELYNREKAENAKGLSGSFANLMLNDIFIKSNNPGWLGKTRPGEVYFKRNTQKSVVNFIWKSLQSGLMSTMGYNNKEQRQEKRAWRKSQKKKVKEK